MVAGGNVQQDFRQDYGVQSDGSITVPMVGRVVVGGQTLAQTSKQLGDALILHRIFNDVTVDVTATVFHRVLTAAEKAQIDRAPDTAEGRAVKSQSLY